MQLSIHERDIDERLCKSCAACCRIKLTLKDTDSRYREFLRAVGLSVSPAPEAGKSDCCEKRHDITIDMGYCRHLEVPVKAGDRYSCRIYGSSQFPRLCAQFNCVSWAKANNVYNEQNETLKQAQNSLISLQRGQPKNV